MKQRKVNIFADSTCDLSDELIQQYGITIIPLCILLDEKSYYDKLEIKPHEIFEWADAHKKTPKTAAITLEYAEQILRPCMDAGEDVIFFGISEQMSTTCNVMRLAAKEFHTGNVYVIDSQNLSTGIGLQVLRAAELAASGKTAEEIVKEIEACRHKVHASFVVDTLTYLAMGGRCSSATALLGNALKLHPCIEVENGKMGVGKKYRGKMSSVLQHYLNDQTEQLKSADKTRIFITFSEIDPALVAQVHNYLDSLQLFTEIIETNAGGVISSHCGRGTLGVLYYME